MFGSTTGAQAYANVGTETGVLAASPHRLVLMLFDGADAAITGAITHLRAGRLHEKGRQVSKAMSIVEHGLRASLNKQHGGTIALQLDELYAYIGRKLIEGAARNDTEALEEVRLLLSGLRDAWSKIDPGAQPQEAVPEPQAAVARL